MLPVFIPGLFWQRRYPACHMQIVISGYYDLAFIAEQFQAGRSISLTIVAVILQAETCDIPEADNHIAAFSFDLLQGLTQVWKILVYI
jgi:hypothetical protein